MMHNNNNMINEIYFEDGGNGGLPVVLIHSLAGNTGQWQAQSAHLRPNRRVVVLDVRGHGRSAPPADGSYAIESMADDVRAVVKELDLEKIVLVGHSMGGLVAAAYAGSYPEQVAGVLFVDPSGDGRQVPEQEVQGLMGALASDGYSAAIEGYWQQILEGAAEETWTAVMEDLRQTPKETIIGVMDGLFRFNPLPALEQFGGPRLSVISPLNEMPGSLHKLVPDLPHKLVTGTGHWLQMDKPAEFNQIMDDFLAQVDEKEELSER
jgi:pimeloyl-ACP methyl ester carboxylesterase